MILTYFMPLVSFYTSWKRQETSGFLMFLGGIEIDQWYEMGGVHHFLNHQKRKIIDWFLNDGAISR